MDRLLEHRDAHIDYDASTSTWAIGNSLTDRRIQCGPNGLCLVALGDVRSNVSLLANESSPEFRFSLAGEFITSTAFKIVSFSTSIALSGSVKLEVTLDHRSSPLRAVMSYECYPAAPAIICSLGLTNVGSEPILAISNLQPLGITASTLGRQPDLLWVCGSGDSQISVPNADGTSYSILRSERLRLGECMDLASGCRSAEDALPWFAILGESSAVFGGVVWSGRWRIELRRADDESLWIRGGAVGNVHALSPGGHITGAASFVGLCRNDPNEVAQRTASMANDCLAPARPSDFPWTQYNTWFAYGVDFDESILRQEVMEAREIGLEVFVVDAGWYRGDRLEGHKFSAGIGDWREDSRRFPSGLRSFAKYVRSLGMRFGLWIEPERVALRTEREGGWRSEWLAEKAGKPVHAHWTDVEGGMGCLCLGHPDARLWLKGELERLILEYDLDWLKWDSNFWVACDCPHHGHGSGDGEHFQVQGLYDVIDSLRAGHPSLVIENCAAGGYRLDYGLLRRTRCGWVSDFSAPAWRVRAHFAGASMAFPAWYLNSWVIDSADEPLNDLSRSDLDTVFRSRMLGAFGVSSRASLWSLEVKDAARRALTAYRSLRPLICNASLFRVMPARLWEVYQYWDRASGCGAVLCFRDLNANSDALISILGVEGERSYSVTAIDAATNQVASGALLQAGVWVRLRPDQTSEILIVSEV